MDGSKMRKSTAAALVVSSSASVYALWKLLQWRARKRAQKSAEQIRTDGPMIDYNDGTLREKYLLASIKRASKWMSLSEAKPMVGQVGGVSSHKKPVLSLRPDYVLKPVIPDHRGIREIAFYETLKKFQKPKPTTVTKQITSSSSSTTTNNNKPKIKNVKEYFDTIAMALAMLLHDPVVLKYEKQLRTSRRNTKKETELLKSLCKFTPSYYGVLGQETIDLNTPFGITNNAHLLLQDLTVNYVKPCVMDLKMGTQTYEPDAPPEKRTREFQKYPEQGQFGFRVVGMRFFDPSQENNYRYYQKPFGRSLKTDEAVKDAFRLFFTVNDNDSKTTNNNSNGPNSTNEATTNGGSKDVQLRSRSISNLLFQLKSIRRWFEENDRLQFCASSLLIVYDADSPTLVSIKMIDFGRVRRQNGGDPGYSKGLETLKTIWTDLLAEVDDDGRILKPPQEENAGGGS